MPKLMSENPYIILSIKDLRNQHRIFRVGIIGTYSVPIRTSSPRTDAKKAVSRHSIVFHQSHHQIFKIQHTVVHIDYCLNCVWRTFGKGIHRILQVYSLSQNIHHRIRNIHRTSLSPLQYFRPSGIRITTSYIPIANLFTETKMNIDICISGIISRPILNIAITRICRSNHIQTSPQGDHAFLSTFPIIGNGKTQRGIACSFVHNENQHRLSLRKIDSRRIIIYAS